MWRLIDNTLLSLMFMHTRRPLGKYLRKLNRRPLTSILQDIIWTSKLVTSIPSTMKNIIDYQHCFQQPKLRQVIIIGKDNAAPLSVFMTKNYNTSCPVNMNIFMRFNTYSCSYCVNKFWVHIAHHIAHHSAHHSLTMSPHCRKRWVPWLSESSCSKHINSVSNRYSKEGS